VNLVFTRFEGDIMSWFKRKKKETDVIVSEKDKAAVVEAPEITKELIRDIIRPILDPDLNVSIVDLGLIKEVYIDENRVHVEMILTTPGCPHGPMLLMMTQRILELKPYLDHPTVELVMGEYLKLEDLTDEMRLNLGLDF